MRYGIGKFLDQKPVNYHIADFTRINAYCNRVEGLRGREGKAGTHQTLMRLKNATLSKKGK